MEGNGNWETDAKVMEKRNYEIKPVPIKALGLAKQQLSKCVHIFKLKLHFVAKM